MLSVLDGPEAGVVLGKEIEDALGGSALAAGFAPRENGAVAEGESHVDESMVTGEPMPGRKTAGSPVVGGTVNGTGALAVRLSRVGADTVLAGIVRMVEGAQASKLPIQAVVERVTRWFVPAVLALALLTVPAWDA